MRDVLIYKTDAQQDGPIPQLASGARVATSSTRRQAQLRAARPDLQLEEIRGNVPTRLEKLAEDDGMACTILAAAGLNRLHFSIKPDGTLEGDAVPEGIRAVALDTDLMLPCVGQAGGPEVGAAAGPEVQACETDSFRMCERSIAAGMYSCDADYCLTW